MSDPRAPLAKRTVQETVPRRDEVARRLRLVGATQDEVDAVMRTWDEMDDEWTERARYDFAHLSDATLRGAIARVREEYPFHEERRTELLEADPTAVAVGALGGAEPGPVELPEGAPAITETVASLEEWVGGDPGRAALVRDAELADSAAKSQGPRKTLIEKMDAVARG